MTPQLVFTIGYMLSGLFPLVALVRRLWINIRRNRELDQKIAQRGHTGFTFEDFDEQYSGDIRGKTRAERRDIAYEVLLVGVGGVTLASVTSIATVWIH